MKKWSGVLVVLAYVVTWKAVGMGDKQCDTNEYTGAEVHCEKSDVAKERWFNTRAGADDFVKAAPSGVKDMNVDEKERPASGMIIYNGKTWGNN